MARDDIESVPVEELVHSTDNAILMAVEGEEVWVGKSVIQNLEDLEEELAKPPEKRSSKIVVDVPQWVAIQNGWVEED